MKKIIHILLIFFLLIPSLIVPQNLNAKTLRDLKNALEKTKQEYEENQNKEKLTQDQINKINTNIKNINATMKQINTDMQTLNSEIIKLEKDIVAKEGEIKEIVSFIQLANGESAYLEYAFGAKDFTDFIYRMAISEQLTDYNDKLIKEYNDMIENNKKKQVELTQKEKDLKVQQKNLEKELKKVQSSLKDIYDIYVDLEESIKVQESVIKVYEQQYHCTLDQDINDCIGNKLPPDTSFWRPLKSGSPSSEYGNRCYWINGKYTCDFHTGLDIATPVDSPVYATASGTVAALTIKYYCGGNMVFLHHNVNGKMYTSLYMHLRTINVKVGDRVDKNTIIGYSGGAQTPWDSCSTGAHLHFTMMSGRVGVDYAAWSATFYSSLLNPRTVVNFPWGWFGDRTTKY